MKKRILSLLLALTLIVGLLPPLTASADGRDLEVYNAPETARKSTSKPDTPVTSTTKILKATYTGTKITLDGQILTPKDANGKWVEPFAVDGTTYLPIRAVANALGLGVNWDQTAKTVKLDSKNPGPEPEEGDILYVEFYAFGDKVCNVYFPFSWRTTLSAFLDMDNGSVILYDIPNRDYGGRLFGLHLFSNKAYRDYAGYRLLYPIRYNGKVYDLVLSTPTDVQHAGYGPLMESYSAKISQLDSIVSGLVFAPSAQPVNPIVKKVKAAYTGTKVTLDGQTVPLKDADGKTVEPFAVDGTTYLPIRAVANALGLDVGWDQATKTVKLKTKTEPVPTPEPDIPEGILVPFQAFGGTAATIHLPESWQDDFVAENQPDEGILTLFDKTNKENGHGGELLSLRLYADDSYPVQPEVTPLYPIEYQGSTYQLVAAVPSGSQFDPDDSQAMQGYLNKDLDRFKILTSIQLADGVKNLGTELTTALTYEAFGDVFATINLPADWEGRYQYNWGIGDEQAISVATNDRNTIFELDLYEDESYTKYYRPFITVLYDVEYKGKTYHLVAKTSFRADSLSDHALQEYREMAAQRFQILSCITLSPLAKRVDR